ncbi:MAG: hypothetical protein DRP95_01330 [Candidatus Latescibacterota bacterium]|nr:MAG: hypothetical protein DRP95_01330 [Candidatus Latescibacterota bacterium]
MRRFWIWATLAMVVVGCGYGYYYYAGPLKPVGESEQVITGMAVYDDGTVTFTKERLEVSLRPMTDEELNRQFASASKGGPKATNPYTYGDSKYRDLGITPQRFTVFRLKVKNYTYPKVLLDPTKMIIVADNGREYWALSLEQLTLYYRTYAVAYAGNEYDRFEARKDILKRTLYPGDPIFSGQEQEGYVVFPALHPDVDKITVWVKDMVLRFDYKDEPIETMDVAFRFRRDIGKMYPDGRIELAGSK